MHDCAMGLYTVIGLCMNDDGMDSRNIGVGGRRGVGVGVGVGVGGQAL